VAGNYARSIEASTFLGGICIALLLTGGAFLATSARSENAGSKPAELAQELQAARQSENAVLAKTRDDDSKAAGREDLRRIRPKIVDLL
jgi:hypothetical protein